MRCLPFLLLAFFTAVRVHAQVLNIESLRFLHDTDGWMGQVQLAFSAQQNVNQVISLGNNVHVQYRKGHSRWIFLNDINFSKGNEQEFVNTGYQHVRYNYHIGDSTSRWTWEAFVQTQYNKPMKMDFRGVIGTGPRFRLVKKPKLHVYVASLFIHEHEIDNEDHIVYDDERISSYLTCSWEPFQHAEIVNTVYYQPSIADINDYRIAEDFNFNTMMGKHFLFGVVFGLLDDTKQPPGIPNLSWHIDQLISFSF